MRVSNEDLHLNNRCRGAFFSIYSFAVIFALFGIGSSSYNALFTSSLSTLEKRYRFPSSSGSYTMITDNIATVLTSLFIGYYGKTAHKPRWMSAACLITGFSVMLTALPYFIFGPPTSDDIVIAKNMTLESIEARSKVMNYQVCDPDSPSITQQCDKQTMLENSYVTFVALFCFAASNFFRGFGTSIFFTYGSPYLDDNVNKSQMPLIFACIFASRLFGSPMGLLMSSFSLQYYENPFSPPRDITKADPTWIGAWWLGFVLFGAVLMLLSIPLSFFPAEFKKAQDKEENEPEADFSSKIKSKENNHGGSQLAKPGNQADVEQAQITKQDTSLKNLPSELLALIKNPLIICQLIGNMFRGVGLLGFYVFQTKYIENQFSQTASKASFITGSTGFPAKIGGVLFGGLLITAFRPGPRTLTSYIFLVEVSSVFVLIWASTFMGPHYEYPNTSRDLSTGQMNLLASCNQDCNCQNVRYQPVCDVSGGHMAFFSACHAGCRKSFAEADDSHDTNFSDCSCIPPASDVHQLHKCQPETNNTVQSYAWVIATGGMISGSGRTGNTITLLRSIRPDQKAMAVALSSFWHSLVVSIPYPILYGKLFDWSCMFWQRECTKKGNCWLYDTEKLRVNYHYVTIVFVILGSVFDLIMIFLSPRLGNLYDDDQKSFFASCFGTCLDKVGPKKSINSKNNSSTDKDTNKNESQEANSEAANAPSSAGKYQLEQFDLPERPSAKHNIV